MDGLKFRKANEVLMDTVTHLADPPKGVCLDQWPTFSTYLGGLRPHELTLLCAPTGSGKTQWLANASAQLLRLDVPHFAAPVETGDVDFMTRVLGCLAGSDLNSGDSVSVERLQRMQSHIEFIGKKEFWLSSHDNRVAVEDMILELKFMHQQGCRVAFLDNLNFFLKVTSSALEKAEMDNAIHSFVILAKEIPMHIILVVHPKKTDGGRVESEFDIKGSSTAVQECANVILFNRPEEKQVESGERRWSDRELVFKKIRKRGMHVNKPIWFAFDGVRYNEMRGKQ